MSKNNLKTSLVTDLDSYYLYTGQPLTLNYTLTAADGNVLVENVDYTTTISPTAEVQECGEYTITFKGIGEYTDSLKKNFIVEVKKTVLHFLFSCCSHLRLIICT